MRKFILNFFGVPAAIAYFKTVVLHCTERLTPDERTFIPVYLCGPPMMINACIKMLDSLNVDSSHIAFDEF